MFRLFDFVKRRGDEEIVDQKKLIEDSCKSKCVQSFSDYLVSL